MIAIFEQFSIAVAVGLAVYLIARMEKPMPIECVQLAGRPVPYVLCPECGERFEPFLRGQVQRRRFKWFLWGPWPYCALICWACKEIVGYEEPGGRVVSARTGEDWVCPMGHRDQEAGNA